LLKNRRLTKETLIWLWIAAPIFMLLFLFVFWPILNVIFRSFIGDFGGFTLSYYIEFFTTRYFHKVFWNSIFVASLTAGITTFLGFLMAYTVTRTNAPLRNFFAAISYIPIISPPFVIPVTLILMFGRKGLFTYYIFKTGFSIYGWYGIVLSEIFYYLPYAFIVISGVLLSIDSTLEEAARQLGAKGFDSFRTVTFQLAKPGIIGAASMVFYLSMADFATPMMIGGNFHILATEAYFQVVGRGHTGFAAAISVILLLISFSAFLLSNKALGKRSYITVTGRGEITSLIRPTKPYVKWPLFSLCMLISIFIILVYALVAFNAFVKVPWVDYSFTLEHFTFEYLDLLNSFKNSLIMASSAALASSFIGVLTAFLVIRKKFLGKTFLDFLASSLFAVPGTVIGIGYILAFNTPPLVLTGTLLILILCVIFQKMPMGYLAAKAALQQIDLSLEQASRSLGAGIGTTFRKITLPLLSPAFIGAVMYAFIAAMCTVSAVIFLIAPGTQLIATTILEETALAFNISRGVALSTILIGVCLVAFLILRLGTKIKGTSLITV